MKILVRLPNWLGDMVMATAVMNQLPYFFPGARISVIVKKGIHELLPLFPPLEHAFVFSKEEYKGLGGLLRFGKKIKNTEKFDLFICLPDSMSAALMGAATGARERIGYKKELRQLLLSRSYTKPEGLHRVEEYINLVERFAGKKTENPVVRLHHQFEKAGHIIVNINSEASSRRLTVNKAVELLTALRQTVSRKLILIGAPKEAAFVDSVINLLPDQTNVESKAGKTTLIQLAELLASAQLMLTTDSGPAHLANALGTHTVVLFGAGNENNTAPYNKENRTIIRLGELTCEPCEKNICVRYGTPLCLENLNTGQIMQAVKLHL